MLLRRINEKKVSPIPRHMHSQSHNGAIAARANPILQKALVEFQSHNGAIAAKEEGCSMRRLKSVSIPQWCDCCRKSMPRNLPVPCCFNPTMVRLLLEVREDGLYALIEVSIPQWCDCCARRQPEATRCVRVSIPQWCDCCKWKLGRTRRSERVSIPQWCDCCR